MGLNSRIVYEEQRSRLDDKYKVLDRFLRPKTLIYNDDRSLFIEFISNLSLESEMEQVSIVHD